MHAQVNHPQVLSVFGEVFEHDYSAGSYWSPSKGVVLRPRPLSNVAAAVARRNALAAHSKRLARLEGGAAHRRQ